jgi:hypothetical protein
MLLSFVVARDELEKLIDIIRTHLPLGSATGVG